MRMTTKSRYAVRALVNLWQRHDHDHPTPLSEIAAEEDISLNFLEQIFMALRREGIVNKHRKNIDLPLPRSLSPLLMIPIRN